VERALLRTLMVMLTSHSALAEETRAGARVPPKALRTAALAKNHSSGVEHRPLTMDFFEKYSAFSSRDSSRAESMIKKILRPLDTMPDMMPLLPVTDDAAHLASHIEREQSVNMIGHDEK